MNKIALIVVMLLHCAYGCAYLNLNHLNTDAFHKEYPHNQQTLIDIINYSVYSENPLLYLCSAFEIFTTECKKTSFINPYSFLDTLLSLRRVLDHVFNSYTQNQYKQWNVAVYNTDMFERLKRAHSTFMINEFSEKYALFQEDPATFLCDLSSFLSVPIQHEFDLLSLRQSLMRFLEHHITRLIWAPKDDVQTWKNVNDLADLLATMVERDIFDDVSDLDKLYWSLVCAYGGCIKVTHELFSHDFYIAVQRDVKEQNTLLMRLSEQDNCIERRADYLSKILMKCHAKKQALSHGLVL